MSNRKMKHLVVDEEEQYSCDMNVRLGGGGGGSAVGGGSSGGGSVGHSSTGYSSTRSGGGGSSSYNGAESYSARNGSSHSKSANKAAATGSTSNHDDDDSHNTNQHYHVSMGEFFQVTLNNGAGDGVVCLKLLVLGTLLLASLLIGNAAFVFTTEEVVETYKEELGDFSDLIIAESQERMANLLLNSKAIRDRIVLYNTEIEEQLAVGGHTANATLDDSFGSWPFVTIPDFEARHHDYLELNEAATELDLIPLVTKQDRVQYEEYAMTHQGWIQSGLDFRYTYELEHSSRDEEEEEEESHDSILDIKPHESHVSERLIASDIPSYIHVGKDEDEETDIDYGHDHEDEFIREAESSHDHFFAPIWQTTPVSENPKRVNFNMLSIRQVRDGYDWVKATHLPAVTEGMLVLPSALQSEAGHHGHEEQEEEPLSFLLEPIFDTLENHKRFFDGATRKGKERKLVGLLSITINWRTFFDEMLPRGSNNVLVVLSNTCGQTFSIVLNGGKEAYYLGEGDLHDPNHKRIGDSADILTDETLLKFHQEDYDERTASASSALSSALHFCPYTIEVYPTPELARSYDSNQPLIFTATIVFIFVLATVLFLVYDCMAEQRQDVVTKSNARANALVGSLFPEQVRNRLMDDTSTSKRGRGGRRGGVLDKDGQGKDGTGKTDRYKQLVQVAMGAPTPNGESNMELANDDENNVIAFHSKPIADLFPSTTVMFADIAGFTAWSSAREPVQVFTLLEGVYNSFDAIAKKRKVFKVETVGDSYVAVCGLPEPRKDHAVVMARYAHEISIKFIEVANDLELVLGPGTGDLKMRLGLHSGPVTGGVLRGEKSRFQLFGDTVNTAARMESTGKPNKIQVSQETADLLVEAGHAGWLKPRSQLIHAKGKGELKTYWVDLLSERKSVASSVASSSGYSSQREDSSHLSSFIHSDGEDSDDESLRSRLMAKKNAAMLATKGTPQVGDDEEDDPSSMLNNKTKRAVQWLVQMLVPYLKKIVAMREVDVNVEGGDEEWHKVTEINLQDDSAREIARTDDESSPPADITVLDQVKEIIKLPKQGSGFKRDWQEVKLGSRVENQLFNYVSSIASMYRDNSFHGFEHASHVTMSAVKLLTRVVAEHSIDYADMSYKQKDQADLHAYTHGISDPLTQFAIIFSALIHDVDHTGVPNATLVEENSYIAEIYRNKSVAEQNSVDLAWGLLMEPSYRELRNCLCATNAEIERFRQLVVNSVMATDIADKELGALRRQRWEKAFSKGKAAESALDAKNRKATIVIEHLIQAADVSHTMQHWHIYQKWNQKLFEELYKAYKDGRSDSDPSEGWYKGELGFFDFYLIPLAKKLRDCGVFGVSSDEYLNYALLNRAEWEKKGQGIVELFRSQAIQKFAKESNTTEEDSKPRDKSAQRASPASE